MSIVEKTGLTKAEASAVAWVPWRQQPEGAEVRRTFWLPMSEAQPSPHPAALGVVFELTDDWEVALGRWRRALAKAQGENPDCTQILGASLPAGVSWVYGTHDDLGAVLGFPWEKSGPQGLGFDAVRSLAGFPTLPGLKALAMIHVTALGFWFSTVDNSYEGGHTDTLAWASIQGFKP